MKIEANMNKIVQSVRLRPFFQSNPSGKQVNKKTHIWLRVKKSFQLKPVLSRKKKSNIRSVSIT
jgi:hypothetical protein